MTQVLLFAVDGDDLPTPQPKQKPSRAAKRIGTAAIQKVEVSLDQAVQAEPATSTAHPEVQIEPARWELCRVCGSPIGFAAARRAVAQAIAIPGNDASLCSNPTRTCRSSGWVTNLDWLSRSSRQGVSHE